MFPVHSPGVPGKPRSLGIGRARLDSERPWGIGEIMPHPRSSRALALSALFVFALAAAAADARAATFDLVATHPEVALQTTFYGDHIATLKPFNGRLYAGYGDYGANTGPIAVRAYDPTLGGFTDSMLTSATEAIYIYRELGGKLYAPNIDTRGGNSGYAVGVAGTPPDLDTWQDVITVPGIHMFDMNTWDGSDLFQGGAGGNDGVVWRSTDGGGTWNESLRVTPNAAAGASFVRVHGLGRYQGKLYADVEQVGSSGGGIFYIGGRKAGTSMVFDGTSWSTGPMLTSSGHMSHPEEFGGKLIYLDNSLGAGHLMGYDGSRVAQVYKPKGRQGGSAFLYGYTVVDGVLYGLSSDMRVISTTDLKTWSLITTGPSGSRAIGLLDGMLYLGGVGGNLYQYSDPLATASLSASFLSVTSFDAVPEPVCVGILSVAALALIRRTPASRLA